jgi:hypothetical protein
VVYQEYRCVYGEDVEAALRYDAGVVDPHLILRSRSFFVRF